MRIAIACVAFGTLAQAAAGSADEHWQSGVSLYETQRYEEATVQFEQAVSLAPGSSEYHHWLGKSVGRTAEQANWFSAIGLALRTRQEFETAVRLDGRNSDALRDLMEFYLRAPVFLGGSDKKAAGIEQRLRDLQPPGND